MAIVRITETLKSAIRVNVDKMFALQLATAQQWDCPISGDYVYDTIFAAWRTHMDALPKEMLICSTSLTINSVCGIPINHKFMFASPRPTPRVPDMPHVRSVNSFYGSGAYELLPGTGQWQELFDYAVARDKRITAVTDKIKQVKEGVDHVLKHSATLAPALKAWPALWDLLPESIKEKHKQVVERKQSSAPEAIDTSALTGAIAFAKLTR